MSSSSVEQQVVQHLTHIHPLTKVDEYGVFKCNGCKTNGFGKTYRCAPCHYDLHDHCAICPSTLISFMHPQHALQLVLNGPEHICNICHGLVEGFYYHCETCSFYVHPLCTQHHQLVSYVPHPDHLLELSQCGASNTCMVCQGAILSWRYKCGPCMLDIHVECLNSSAPANTEPQMDLNTSILITNPDNGEPECIHNSDSEDTNESQVPRRSKRRRAFRFLTDLTVNAVYTIIAEM